MIDINAPIFSRDGDEIFITDSKVYQRDIEVIRKYFPTGSKVYLRKFMLQYSEHSGPLHVRSIIHMDGQQGLKHVTFKEFGSWSIFVGNICYRLSDVRREKIKHIISDK